MSKSRIRPRAKAAILRRPVTSLTTLALLFQSIVPAYAQMSPDPNAGARQPQIDRAANGTPVVNITTPNATGLSHNQFSQFNVGPEGLVLNNSAELTTSQIAGLVLGNSNLVKGNEATLILNEVTSTNRSQLLGYMEVLGKPAAVIVANPNGITCSGCGFINMPRVTLTTGRPVIDGSGAMRSFTVDDGSIVIGANGLDASRVSRFELVSRLIEISGALHAQELAVSGGRQSYDYGAQTSAALPEDGRAKPQFFLDGSALGGMYAGRIRIIGNELGLGVRAPDKLLAASGDLSIDTKGRIAIKGASATGNLTLRSTDAVEINGTTYAEGDAAVTAGSVVSIADGAVLGARNNLTLTAQSLAVGNGIIAAGLASDGTLAANSGSAQFRIGGASTIASGGLISGGDRLDFIAGSLANSGTIQADTLLALTTGGDMTNAGRLLGSNDIQLGSGGTLTVGSSASIEAGRDLSLGAAALAGDGAVRANRDAAVNAGAARLASLTVGRDLKLTASDLTVTRSVVAGGDAALSANTVGIGEGATLGSVGSLSLSADTVNNAGILASEAGLTLAGRSHPSSLVLTNTATGRLAGGTGFTATYASLQNSGLLTSDGAFALTGGSFSNAKEVTAKGALTLRTGPIANSGVISAATLDIASNAALTNTQTGVLQATGNVGVVSAGLTNAGRIVSNSAVTLGLDTFSNEGGTVVAGTDLAIGGRAAGSSATIIRHLSGQIGSVSGDTRLVAGTIDNQAAIAAGRDLLITASGRVDGSTGSRFEAGRDLTLTGASALANLGSLRANRDMRLAATSITTAQISSGADLQMEGTTLDNAGDILAGGSADLRLTSNLTNRAGATIGGVAGLSVISPSIDNAGVVASEGAVALAGATSGIAGRLINRPTGRISGATGLTATFAGLENAGVVTSAADLSLTGLDLINDKEITANGTVALRFATIDQSGLTSGRVLSITDTDKVEIATTGVLQATDALSIKAGSVTNLGLIASGGTLSASVFELTNDHASIIARGNLTIEGLIAGSRAGRITNASGGIESVQGNILLAANLIENKGDALTELRTTEIRHQFVQTQPPPGIAYYPDLISAAGYFQLYDEGRTRSYAWVPSPEKVNEILAAEGITIDQWTPTLWQKYAPDAATFDPDDWAIYIPDEARHAPAGSYIAARDESDVVVRQNAPGQIITGAGNIRIDAGVLRNTLSTISANGDMTLTGGSVINEGKTLTRSYSLSLSYNNDTVRGEGWVRPGGGPTAWFARGNPGPLLARQEIIGVIPSTINATGTITGNLAGSFVNVGSPATDPSTLSFANTSTTLVTITRAPPATSVSMAALAGTSGTGADVTASTAPIPTNIRIPESTLRQFAPADPGSRFLIETRLQFINPADYFGSEYFFSRLGTRPDDDIKFLGDAYFDFLLIRDQIIELTGKRFLNSALSSEQSQIAALLAAGAKFILDNNIELYQPLTREQQSRLTEDVVIYEKIEYGGRTVLIPQLYLSSTTQRTLDSESARVRARRIAIDSANIINSEGVFRSDGALRLSGGTIVDLGGKLAGNSVVLEARDSIQLLTQIDVTGNGTDLVGATVGNRTRVEAGDLVVRAPNINMAGSTVNVANNATIAADTFTLTPAEAEIAQRYKDKSLSYDIYQKTLFVPQVTVGGDLSIQANDAALIRAATLNVGKDIKINAGTLLIESGETESRSSGAMHKKTFMGKSETTWDYITVTQVPSVIRANGNIILTTTIGDTIVRASVLDGANITVDSAGKIDLQAAYDQVYRQDTRSGSSFVWVSAKDKGIDQALVVQTELRSTGEVRLNAQDGIVIQVRKNGSLTDSIDTIAQAPGLAWMKQVQARPDVRVELLADTYRQWDYESAGLSGPAAAIIALAVAVATAGSGTPLVFAQGSLAQTVFAAGFNSLVTQAAIGLVNAKGNPLEALKSIASTDYARSLATTLITAGLLHESGLTVNNPDLLVDRLQNGFVRAGVGATVETIIIGGSFEDNLSQRLRAAVVLSIGGEAAQRIGDAAKAGDISDASRLIAQTALGCGIGASLGSSCSAGAVGALAGEIAGGAYGDNALLSGRRDLDAIRAEGVDIAALAGGLAAALAGGDVSTGATTGSVVAQENALGRLAVTAVKLSGKILKDLVSKGKLSPNDIKEAGLDDLVSAVDDVTTIINPSASTVEKAFAILGLVTGVGKDEVNYLAKVVRSVAARRSVERIISPNGRLIGTVSRGATGEVRTVSSGEFSKIVDDLRRAGAVEVEKVGYPGKWYKLSDGVEYGIRSSRSGPTLDLNIDGYPKGLKVHQK